MAKTNKQPDEETQIELDTGLRCPVCWCPDVYVLRTEKRAGQKIKRRRVCQNGKCGHRFNTYETANGS